MVFSFFCLPLFGHSVLGPGLFGSDPTIILAGESFIGPDLAFHEMVKEKRKVIPGITTAVSNLKVLMFGLIVFLFCISA